MKRTLLVAALALGTGVFAQDLTSKKGEPILPEAGDWAIGVDANPFLNYAGNFFGKQNDNLAPSFNFHNTRQVITGKYFVDAQTAYRGGLRLGFTNQSNRQMVDDRASTSFTAYPNPTSRVENVWKESSTAVGLSAGIEKRRGKTRLQGFYGAELGIYMQSSKDKFEYGNGLNPNGTPGVFVDVNQDEFFGANNTDINPGIQAVDANGARAIERKNGMSFGVGVRAFIGAEYFILPKMSIGGEFGWGIGMSTFGKSTTTYESTGFVGSSTTLSPSETVIEGSKQGGFSIDTDNAYAGWGPSGSLRLNFHF